MNRVAPRLAFRLLCSGLLSCGLVIAARLAIADEPAEKPLQFRIDTEEAPGAKPGEGIIIRIGEDETVNPAKKKNNESETPKQTGSEKAGGDKPEGASPDAPKLITGKLELNPWGGKSAAQWYIDSIDKTAQLSDQQKEQIKKIIESREAAQRKVLQENADKIEVASQAVRKVLKTGDRDAIAKSQKMFQEVYASYFALGKKFQAALDEVLSKEQRAKIRESQMEMLLKGTTDAVELSAEQRAKLKAAFEESYARDQQPWPSNWPKLISDVLTPEQKQTIFEHHAKTYVKAAYGRAKLSDDQLQKINHAIHELAERSVGEENDGQLYSKLAGVVGGVLTDEQKQTFPAPGGKAELRERDENRLSPEEKTFVAPEGQRFTIILKEPNESSENGEAVKKAIAYLQDAQGNRERAIGERMRRQHELAERAWQTYRNIEALGKENPGEAKKFWEELGRIQAELHEATVANRVPGNGIVYTPGPGMPGAMSGGPAGAQMPGMMAGGDMIVGGPGIVRFRVRGSTAAEDPRFKGLEMQAAKLAEISQRLSQEIQALREGIEQSSRMPAQPATEPEKPDIRGLQNQLDALRRQMDEIQSRLH